MRFMNREELIKKLKEIKSTVDFYGFKDDILSHLGDSRKERTARKKILQSMSMAELRKIGSPLGAKDTNKSELIEEILDKEKL